MTVQYDFSGKAAVVTGGAKGIGHRTAETLRCRSSGLGLGHRVRTDRWHI